MLGTFASNYLVKMQRNPDDLMAVVMGKAGHIYEYSDTELGVMFMPGCPDGRGWGAWKPKTWGNYRRAGIALGMTLRQNGDSEGAMSFNPGNEAQCRLAPKIARVRRGWVLSPENRAKAIATLAQNRVNPTLEAPYSV